MGTVANSNYGFKGAVSSAETPQVLGNGSLYSVEGKDDLKVTAGGTGDRAVTVAAAPNGAWGDAVLSKWTTGANLNCAANSTGSTRYDTVVIRRTWTPAGTPTGTATLMVLTGGSSVAIAAGRLTDRGITSSDQPIALVPVPNGSAVVGTPIDLRCWTGEGGGLVAEHVAALQYMGSKGSQVQIGTTTYTRLEDGTGTSVWGATGPAQQLAAVTSGASLPGGGTLGVTGYVTVDAKPYAQSLVVSYAGLFTSLSPSTGVIDLWKGGVSVSGAWARTTGETASGVYMDTLAAGQSATFQLVATTTGPAIASGDPRLTYLFVHASAA